MWDERIPFHYTPRLPKNFPFFKPLQCTTKQTVWTRVQPKQTVFNLNCTNKLLNLLIYLLEVKITNPFTTTSKFTNFTAYASGNYLYSTVNYKNPPFIYIYTLGN